LKVVAGRSSIKDVAGRSSVASFGWQVFGLDLCRIGLRFRSTCAWQIFCLKMCLICIRFRVVACRCVTLGGRQGNFSPDLLAGAPFNAVDLVALMYAVAGARSMVP